MRKYLIPFALVALALSPACYTHEQAGATTGAIAGAAIGHDLTGGSAVGTLIGAAIGASIGADIGRQMDEADRRRAVYALEHYPTGDTYYWVNPDTGYEYGCTPVRTYRGARGPCRDYVLYTEIDGEPAEIEGTACRHPDGSWRAVD